MTRHIFFLIFLIYSTISCVFSDGRCQLLPERGEDSRSIVYSCVEVTFDHVEDISSHANWIEFSVSKLNIPGKAFARFSLHTLSFYKCDIRDIDPTAFEGLVDLQKLTFWESNINILKASWFKGLNSLIHLSLKNNGIVYIEPKTFLEIPNLQHLNIEDNNLNCLPEHALAPLRHLKNVRIGKNPWLCNCYADIVKWMLNRRIDFGTKNALVMKFECMDERSYKSNNVKSREVFRNSSSSESAALTISTSGDGSCMSKTLSILSPTPDDVGSIKLSGIKISTIPEFAFFQFGNSLRNLDMSNCSIRVIHSEAFAGLPKLERLVLFNNNITTVKAEWFRDLRGLKHLLLDDNDIKYIESNVFPLLDKLETLSIQHNGIKCLSTDSFGLLKNLKHVNIAKNPWNCSCLNEFRAWLDKTPIGYHVSLGDCTMEKGIQTSGGKYETGYWNSSFERNFTSNEIKFNNQNFTETHGTFTESHYDFPTEFQSYYHQSTKNNAEHRRNRKSTGYIHHINVRESQQNMGRGCQTGYPQRPGTSYICHSACKRVEIESYNGRYFYECSGGTLADLSTVPDVAESIKFEHSTIPVIQNYAFARFGSNLRSLSLSNCRIQTIEPQAFSGLVNLQELTINGNDIHEVQSSWFESTSNLQRLVLTQNSIGRIENGVFQFLTNLEYLVISDNGLNCIGIDSLNHMWRLRVMDVHKNPWSCLCRKKLIEWMNEHRVKYNQDVVREYLDWDCGNQTPYPINPWPTIPPLTTRAPFTPSTTRAPFTPSTTRATILQTTLPPQPSSPSPPHPFVRPPLNGRCKLDPLNSFRCTCFGGDRYVIDEIPSDVERIEIINATISELGADSFARFKNLKELLFFNCTIGIIDESAFRGLHKLKMLVFQGSSISTIRSAWFHDLTALTELDLTGNYVTEIEGDVFEYLPNLKILSLNDNGIQCIYTKSLSVANKLEKISLENNPWKWRCLEELTQFLNERNINYTNFRTYRGKRITCELKTDGNAERFEGSGTTNASNSTVNVLCVSIAMLIFTKF